MKRLHKSKINYKKYSHNWREKITPTTEETIITKKHNTWKNCFISKLHLLLNRNEKDDKHGQDDWKIDHTSLKKLKSKELERTKMMRLKEEG